MKEDLKRCVVDLLMYADHCLSSVGQALGLPRLSLGVLRPENVVSFYGLRLKEIFLRVREKDFEHFHATVSETTVEQLIHLVFATESPEIAGRHAAVLKQLRSCLAQNQLTGTLRFDAMIDSLTGAFECMVKNLSKEDAAEAKKIAGLNKAPKRPKNKKKTVVSPKTVVREFLADLIDRFGLSHALNEIAAAGLSYMHDRDRRREDWSAKVTPGAVRAFLKRSFAPSKKADPKVVLGLRVTTDVPPLEDGGSNNGGFAMVVTDDRIELRRGVVSVDLSVLLPQTVMFVALLLKRFSENTNDVKELTLKLIDACVEVFETAHTEASHAVRSAALNRLKNSPDNKFAFRQAHAKALTNLGLLSGGNGVPASGDSHVMQYPG